MGQLGVKLILVGGVVLAHRCVSREGVGNWVYAKGIRLQTPRPSGGGGADMYAHAMVLVHGYRRPIGL